METIINIEFFSLPPEIITQIARFLPYNEVAKFRLVSSMFAAITSPSLEAMQESNAEINDAQKRNTAMKPSRVRNRLASLAETPKLKALSTITNISALTVDLEDLALMANSAIPKVDLIVKADPVRWEVATVANVSMTILDMAISDVVVSDTTTPSLGISDIIIPDMAISDIIIPDMAISDMTIPDLPVPSMAIPNMAVLDLAISNMATLDMTIPGMTIQVMIILDLPVPDMAIPNMAISDLAVSDMVTLDMTIPGMTIQVMIILNLAVPDMTIAEKVKKEEVLRTIVKVRKLDGLEDSNLKTNGKSGGQVAMEQKPGLRLMKANLGQNNLKVNRRSQVVEIEEKGPSIWKFLVK
ncbi:periaxin [Ditylenchus destructor]|nr:periaxin [Ditylenchus destructor]